MFHRNLSRGDPLKLFDHLLAFNLSFRKNSKVFSWEVMVPILVCSTTTFAPTFLLGLESMLGHGPTGTPRQGSSLGGAKRKTIKPVGLLRSAMAPHPVLQLHF